MHQINRSFPVLNVFQGYIFLRKLSIDHNDASVECGFGDLNTLKSENDSCRFSNDIQNDFSLKDVDILIKISLIIFAQRSTKQ